MKGRFNYLLPPILMARETVRLMSLRLRRDDAPFSAVYRCSVAPMDFTLPLDGFSDKYLAEAADTMTVLNAPASARDLSVLSSHDGAVCSYYGIDLRVLSYYDARTSQTFLRFDAQYARPLELAAAA